MDSGTILADRYEMLERLGRGGMGEVWAARDRTLRRSVAVKLMLMGEGAPADLAARFEREAVAAAQINHPNVVALFDRGTHADMLFLVMELVDGMPLSTLIDSAGVLTLHRALELAEQICAALEATHRSGVVHFDVKPQNVMVTAEGLAKVVDFGIAGLLQAQQLAVVRTSRLAPAASLEYAAPEQYTAEHGDARSDLYALGGVLFAMLAGHAPFTGHHAWALMAAKMNSDAPRLEQARPGLPLALADLVARLLEREPAQRPRSAQEVRERLARLRADLGGDDGQTAGTNAYERGPEHGSERSFAGKPARPEAAAATLIGAKAVGGGVGSGPRQLPADTGLFTGRADELEELFALAEQARGNGEPGTAVISAIDGMGGVGKTALAVRAAHRLAPRYPDGQLFVDLYGFTRAGQPRDPGDVLATLLGGLGVPPQRIPEDTDARAALYRDRLAGTRTLVVLDNAVDEAQVRPLLPASDTCLVLITSRRRLTALDDALPLALDVLPPAEAVALLRKAARLGGDFAEEPLLARAAELCGHLPLVLLIAGALLRTGGKAWNLGVLIDRLAARRPGRELAGYTDETRSLQNVFDLSYEHLGEDQRRLFRRLDTLPGPELDDHAAAALLGTGHPETAGRLLRSLAAQSLLIGVAPGRYRPHDLIRAHARSLAVTLDPEADRAAALDRLLHYYAHTAQSASAVIARIPRPEPGGPAPAYAPDVQDPDSARVWLRAEHSNLDAAFTHAHTHALDGHAVALAAAMAEILLTDGPLTRAIDIHQWAAEAAERSGRASAQADALAELGSVWVMTDRFAQADDTLGRALEIFRELGHRLGEAQAMTVLGRSRFLTGRHAEGESDLRRAVEIYRELGHRFGEATALIELGRVRFLVGDIPGAEAVDIRALEIFRELGKRLGEATALGDLGRVRHANGDYTGALDVHARALKIYRELGHRFGEANALVEVGRIHYLTGDYSASHGSLSRAGEMYRELDNRLGEAIVLSELGRVRRLTGDLSGAVDVHTRALEIFRELGHPSGEAGALTVLGRVRLMIGDVPGAAEALTEALQIFRRLGEQGNVAWALNYYAAAVAAAGQRARALELYQQALAMNRELNKPDDEAISLEGVAEHHFADGDVEQGAAYLRQALEIFRRLGMGPDIERVRARLGEGGT